MLKTSSNNNKVFCWTPYVALWCELGELKKTEWRHKFYESPPLNVSHNWPPMGGGGTLSQYFWLSFTLWLDDQSHIVSVDISVREHHGRVVLVHDLSRDLTDQSGVGTVGHGQRLGQFVQGFTAHRAVRVLRGSILLVTLTGGERRLRTRTKLIKRSHQYFVSC